MSQIQPPTPPAHWVPPSGHRSPSALAIGAAALAGVVFLIQLASTVTIHPAVESVKDGTFGTDPRAVDLYDFTGMLLIPAGLAAWIVTSLWLSACRKNAEALAPGEPHQRGRVWVWLGWVVPVVSFWFPFQVVRDIRRASTGSMGGPLVGWWWAMWLIWLLLGRAIANLDESADPIDTLNKLAGLETTSAVVAGIALSLWLMIIRQISAGQQALVLRAQYAGELR